MQHISRISSSFGEFCVFCVLNTIHTESQHPILFKIRTLNNDQSCAAFYRALYVAQNVCDVLQNLSWYFKWELVDCQNKHKFTQIIFNVTYPKHIIKTSENFKQKQVSQFTKITQSTQNKMYTFEHTQTYFNRHKACLGSNMFRILNRLRCYKVCTPSCSYDEVYTNKD